MVNERRRSLRIVGLVLVAAAAWLVLPALSPAISLFGTEEKTETPPAQAAPGVPVQTLPDFVTLSKRLSDSVVNISSSSVPERQGQPSPFGGPGGPGGP
ncbi:MAG: hypothetical protein ACREQ9_23800, partial [Candidatus Binatia bacterium]